MSCWTSGVFLLMFNVLVQGQPQYEVQVQLPVTFSYSLVPNGHNLLANGSCCSFNETAPCNTQCSEIQIALCFREANHSLNDTDITNCPLGMITVANEEPGNLTTLIATSNATTTTYPGSYQIVYEVKALEGFIDQVIKIQNNYRNQSTFRVEINGQRTSILIFDLRVVCKKGYFGPDCGCTPQDDSTGHFTCDEDGIIVCLPGYQNTTTNCTNEAITPEPTINTHTEDSTTNTDPKPESPAPLSIAPIAGGGAGGGVLILVIIIILLVCVCKCKNKRRSARNATTVTIGSRSQEEINITDDSLLYSETNKTNESVRPTVYSPTHTDAEQNEAVTITLNQEEEDIYSETLKKSKQAEPTDKEPQYSTPINVTTPQYSVPTSAPIMHYNTPVSTKTIKESQYSTPVSRENTLTRTPQYSAPGSTLPRGQPDEETHYNTPVTNLGAAKETTQSAKNLQIVYADLKVSTLPRAGAEHKQPVKVDKTEEVQYSEIQL